MEISKSRFDSREFQFFSLGNGIQVVCISDPDAQEIAGGLNVGVGNTMDPKDKPGLAHVLEHTLVLGNVEYPTEEEIGGWFRANWGDWNASTGWTGTDFRVTVPLINDTAHVTKLVAGTLGRLASLVRDPLFGPRYIDSSVTSIESEFERNKGRDFRRADHLLYALLCRHHPTSRFTTGSRNSLLGVDDKTVTEAVAALESRALIALETEARNFFSDLYKTSTMKLVVVGPLALAELRRVVETHFGDLKDRSGTRKIKQKGNKDANASDPKMELLIGESEKHKTVFYQPLQPIHRLTLALYFDAAVPASFVRFLAYLLSHKSVGGLYDQFQEQDWVTEVSAGVAVLCKGDTLLELFIDMTEVGSKYYQHMASDVLRFLAYARTNGHIKQKYDEYRQIKEISFHLQEHTSPMQFAETLAEIMQLGCPVQRLLDNDLVIQDCGTDTLQHYFSSISAARLRIMVSIPNMEQKVSKARTLGRKSPGTKSSDSEASDTISYGTRFFQDLETRPSGKEFWKTEEIEREPHYGIGYIFEDWKADFKDSLYNSESRNLVRLNEAEFSLPRTNQFVKALWDPLTAPRVGLRSSIQGPVEEQLLDVHDDQRGVRIMQHTPTLSVSIISQYTLIIRLGPELTPKDHAVLEIGASLLQKNLEGLMFDAENVGLTPSIQLSMNMLRITALGHEYPARKFIVAASEFLRNIPNPTVLELDKAKSSSMQTLNVNRGGPWTHLKEISQRILVHGGFSSQMRVKAVEAVDPLDYLDTLQKVMDRAPIDLLVTGHMSKKAKQDLIVLAEVIAKKKPRSRTESHQVLAFEPEKRFNYTYEEPRAIAGATGQSTDSNYYMSIHLYTGSWGDLAQVASAQLLASMLKAPLFEQLRTKENIGYTIDCLFYDDLPRIIHFIQVDIQTTKLPDFASSRLEVALENFLYYLDEMQHGEFDKIKATFAASRRNRPYNLSQAADKTLGVLEDGSYQFDRDSRIANTVDALAKATFCNFARERLSSSSKSRVTLSVTLRPPMPKDSDLTKEQAKELKKFMSRRKIDVLKSPDQLKTTLKKTETMTWAR